MSEKEQTPKVKPPKLTEPNQNPQICDAIAIDIGTSKCRLAICKDKYIQIIEHESNRAIPSYVALTKSLTEQGKEEWYVGRMAENYAFCLPNVVYDIRWLLGKKVSDVKKDEKNYFFKFNDEDSKKSNVIIFLEKPIIQNKDGGETKSPVENEQLRIKPDEVLSKLLESILTTAFDHVKPLIKIAITVPLKAQGDHRKVIKDATREVVERVARPHLASAIPEMVKEAQMKLNDEKELQNQNDARKYEKKPEIVKDELGRIQINKPENTPLDDIIVELIDEPMAVAAAYAPRLNLHKYGNVALVFCLGAGYLQVAPCLIKPKDDLYEIQKIADIKPITSDEFAGVYFDNLIYDEMIKMIIKKEQKGQKEHFKPKLNPRAQRRLRIACEKMKCALSFAPHTRIDVDSLYRNDGEDIDFTEVIKKEDIQSYIDGSIQIIMKDIKEAYDGIIPDFILLGGGSTRIPLITEGLAEIFDTSKTMICNFLNVDEVAATGTAAIVSNTVEIAKTAISYNDVLTQRKIAEEEAKQTPPPSDLQGPDSKDIQKPSSKGKKEIHHGMHVKSGDEKSPTSPSNTRNISIILQKETPKEKPVDTQRSDGVKPKEGLQRISSKGSGGSQKSTDGNGLPADQKPVIPNPQVQPPANPKKPIDEGSSKTRRDNDELLAEVKVNNGAKKNTDHGGISLSKGLNNPDRNPFMKGQSTISQPDSTLYGRTNPSMTDNVSNEDQHSNVRGKSVSNTTPQPPSSQQRGNSSNDYGSFASTHESRGHGNSSTTHMKISKHRDNPALQQNVIATDSAQSQHDRRQTERGGSTIQGTSGQLAEREVVEALRPENNCHYHKWLNDKYGQSYIDLFLNKMATEYPVRYLIDPAILDFKKCYHIIYESSYVSNTMWWYSKEQTSFQYYVIREIKIELIEYNRRYRTYKCQIIVVYVNSDNFEKEIKWIPQTERTFEQWLKFKLRLEIEK